MRATYHVIETRERARARAIRGHRDDNNYDNNRNGNYVIYPVQSPMTRASIRAFNRLFFNLVRFRSTLSPFKATTAIAVATCPRLASHHAIQPISKDLDRRLGLRQFLVITIHPPTTVPCPISSVAMVGVYDARVYAYMDAYSTTNYRYATHVHPRERTRVSPSM